MTSARDCQSHTGRQGGLKPSLTRMLPVPEMITFPLSARAGVGSSQKGILRVIAFRDGRQVAGQGCRPAHTCRLVRRIPCPPCGTSAAATIRCLHPSRLLARLLVEPRKASKTALCARPMPFWEDHGKVAASGGVQQPHWRVRCWGCCEGHPIDGRPLPKDPRDPPTPRTGREKWPPTEPLVHRAYEWPW
jgi:hypothetical protein